MCFGPVDKSCPPCVHRCPSKLCVVPEPWCPSPGLSISIRLYLLSIQEVHGHDCSLEELRHPCVLVRWTSLVHPVSIVVHPPCVVPQNLGVHRQVVHLNQTVSFVHPGGPWTRLLTGRIHVLVRWTNLVHPGPSLSQNLGVHRQACPSQSDCIFCPSRRSMDTIAHWKNPCFGPVDKSCPPWSILVPEPWCPSPGLSISIRLYLFVHP